MFNWIASHSGHHIRIVFEEKPEIKIKRYHCYCFDCMQDNFYDYLL